MADPLRKGFGMPDELEVVLRAKSDLAKRRGLSVESIALRSVESVTWPDTSLGCPKSGHAYAQVATPGYRLVLSDGSTDFEYHSDSLRRVVFCGTAAGRESEGGVP